MITFTTNTVPVAQPRQRSAVRAGRAFNYTPAKHPVNAFKAAVQVAASNAYHGPPLDGPLLLMVTFRLPRPKNMMFKTKLMPEEPHAKKPDLDNLLKALKDALTGIAWRDDSQVARVSAKKVVTSGDGQPGVFVHIAREPNRY